MDADRIERAIEIEAPIDVVWEVVTQPRHMEAWFNDAAEIEARPGADGRFVWTQKSERGGSAVNVRVERVEPPRLFSFRWNHPDGAEPGEANAPLVEFALEAIGTESTRVRVVESGIAGLARPAGEREAYHADHTSGWGVIVPRLRDYAEERRAAVR